MTLERKRETVFKRSRWCIIMKKQWREEAMSNVLLFLTVLQVSKMSDGYSLRLALKRASYFCHDVTLCYECLSMAGAR